jgi:hypothetical protein
MAPETLDQFTKEEKRRRWYKELAVTVFVYGFGIPYLLIRTAIKNR